MGLRMLALSVPFTTLRVPCHQGASFKLEEKKTSWKWMDRYMTEGGSFLNALGPVILTKLSSKARVQRSSHSVKPPLELQAGAHCNLAMVNALIFGGVSGNGGGGVVLGWCFAPISLLDPQNPANQTPHSDHGLVPSEPQPPSLALRSARLALHFRGSLGGMLRLLSTISPSISIPSCGYLGSSLLQLPLVCLTVNLRWQSRPADACLPR